MRIYNFLYYFLIGLIFLVLSKFVFGFYYLSKNVTKTEPTAVVQYEKLILKPRLQMNGNKFEYITALKGFMESDSSYIFENVISNGYYGNISAGKLVIKDNENVLEFTENPKLNIYVDLVD
jgi:hypothetical protein